MIEKIAEAKLVMAQKAIAPIKESEGKRIVDALRSMALEVIPFVPPAITAPKGKRMPTQIGSMAGGLASLPVVSYMAKREGYLQQLKEMKVIDKFKNLAKDKKLAKYIAIPIAISALGGAVGNYYSQSKGIRDIMEFLGLDPNSPKEDSIKDKIVNMFV